MRFLGVLACAAALACVLAPPLRAAEPAPLVAAASDLKFALDEIAAKFRESGRDVRLVFGSSGNFARQIEQRAPFQMFLSADESYVRRLAERNLTVDDGALYAVGRIVLFAPRESPVKAAEGLAGLRAVLRANGSLRIAIANPEHAPYGRAAMQALTHAGLWDEIRPRLVLGENVSQAAQFAMGAAQGGIFAYALALAPEVSKQGSFVLIPAEWHEPLRQRMVLIEGAGETARAFYEFLQTKPARDIFVRYGFALPGEGS